MSTTLQQFLVHDRLFNVAYSEPGWQDFWNPALTCKPVRFQGRGAKWADDNRSSPAKLLMLTQPVVGHWAVIVLDPEQKCARCFDSLNDGEDRNRRSQMIDLLRTAVKHFYVESERRGWGLEPCLWTFEQETVTRQPDSISCGLYCLEFLRRLVHSFTLQSYNMTAHVQTICQEDLVPLRDSIQEGRSADMVVTNIERRVDIVWLTLESAIDVTGESVLGWNDLYNATATSLRDIATSRVTPVTGYSVVHVEEEEEEEEEEQQQDDNKVE